MNDERLGKEISDHYRETDVAPLDSRESAREVATRLPQVEQVKRRRWRPTWLTRTTQQPTSIPSANGHTPTVPGRTQSMLSPVQAITAGALVFAIGGVLLIAQPFEQQGSIVPGADAEAVASTWVTGDIRPAPSCSDGDIEMDGDVLRSRNIECSPQTWTSSDPRLTGEVSRRWNEDTYQMDDGPGSKSVYIDAAYLRNEDGGWTCVDSGLDDSGSSTVATTTPVYAYTCIGDGGYDGLSAMLVLEPTVGYSEEFVGLIFPGDFPPVPEPPAAE
jgi:hypothetical protein